jgi:hypothetical protein
MGAETEEPASLLSDWGFATAEIEAVTQDNVA